MKIIPNKRQFNIGDIVILKPFPNEIPKYNYLHFNPQMLEFCGIPQMINDIVLMETYIQIKTIGNNGNGQWCWPSDCAKLATKKYENISK